MFEGIMRGLADAVKNLKGKGRITEANIQEGLRQVRTALLEADVNFTVANEFIERVKAQALGQEVLRALDPSEQIINIIYQELVHLMKGDAERPEPLFHLAKDRPSVIMLCGLQGSGKTTTCGKLAMMLRDRFNKKPLLVAADLQRPGAIDQLKTLGEQLAIDVYSETPAQPGAKGPDPVSVCKNAVAHAKNTAHDVIILDTAGRLHIAEMPMDELRQIDHLVRPDDVFFVCDAMTGQDAVNSAKAFNDALDLNGVILTKLDGDARGGAALSIKQVTNVPIKFMGVGEKLNALEEFVPERMAQRIMGKGDVWSIIEKVQRVQSEFTKEEIEAQRKKLEKGDFSLDDFRKQFQQMAKMGGMKDLLKSMPGGMGDMIPDDEDPDAAVKRIQGIIDAMTREERKNPDIIDLSRRRRIALGSGTEAHDIKQFLNQFATVRTFMRQIANMSMMERIKTVMGMGKMGALSPGGMMPKTKIGTGHRKTPKERADERKKKRKQDKKRK
jgi:signal recognition particle subunit SRP54